MSASGCKMNGDTSLGMTSVVNEYDGGRSVVVNGVHGGSEEDVRDGITVHELMQPGIGLTYK